MRLRARRLGAAAVAVVVATTASGCDLAFRADHRLTIVSPAEESAVTLPLVIRWRAAGLPTGNGGSYFAVFVDRAPISPGQSLRAVASSACNASPGCPDYAYLEQHQVYVTAGDSLRLAELPEVVPSLIQTAAGGEHRAIIVLIDGEGRREGDTSFSVDFRVRGHA